MKRFLILLMLVTLLVLVILTPVQASTAVTLVGTLSWSEVEGRHVVLTTHYGQEWALIPATSAIRATLEAGATAGKRAFVRGHEVEVSYYGVPTLEVYRLRLYPH